MCFSLLEERFYHRKRQESFRRKGASIIVPLQYFSRFTAMSPTEEIASEVEDRERHTVFSRLHRSSSVGEYQ